MSGTSSRVIAILEALTGPEADGLSAQEVVERSGLPASTGYRIITELQELGLVHRSASRKIMANFSFQRRLHCPGLEPEMLADACALLSDRLTVAAEVVVLSGHNMLWHIVQQHPDQAIRLRAFPGFMRGAYELDSISRLALAHRPVETLEKSWDTGAFYTAGVDRRSLDWAEARAMIAKLEGQIAPLAEEVRLTRQYVETGAVTQIELLRLETRLAELEGDLAVSRARMPRLDAAIAEAEAQLETARRAYVLTARERLARVQGELSVLRETLRAAEDRVTRTTLRAPVRGVVNTLNVTTIGAVVGPGDPLVEIVPVDDHLLIEARISPQDVAFLRPGDPASVKITAFDYVVYGSLSGTVERIGADTLTDEDGNAFFQVAVRTDSTDLGGNQISPGMVAQVDIQTGRKTVLDYLLNPFLRVRDEALRER